MRSAGVFAGTLLLATADKNNATELAISSSTANRNSDRHGADALMAGGSAGASSAQGLLDQRPEDCTGSVITRTSFYFSPIAHSASNVRR